MIFGTVVLMLLSLGIAEERVNEQQRNYYDQGQWNNEVRPTFRPAPLNDDGTVAETPEVKAIKEYHLSVLAEASKKGLEAANDGWDRPYYQPEQQRSNLLPWTEHKPTQPQQQNLPWEEYSKPAQYDQEGRWNRGPSSTPQHKIYPQPPQTTPQPAFYNKPTYPPAPLNKDGTVAETPEIIALKAKHLAFFQEVRARDLAAKARQQEYHHAQGDQNSYGGVPDSPAGPRPAVYFQNSQSKPYIQQSGVPNNSY